MGQVWLKTWLLHLQPLQLVTLTLPSTLRGVPFPGSGQQPPLVFPAWLYSSLQDPVSFNQTRWHCSLTSWSFPDLLGLIPVQDQFLLAEGPGSHHGLSLSKAGYKRQLCALSLGWKWKAVVN